VKYNSHSPRTTWNRWFLKNFGGAIADRLDQLEQQVQTYQQENQDLKQKLKTEQGQIQQLTKQVDRLERCVQIAIDPTESGVDFGQIDRQFNRLWQYYQDAKVQFEQINRQLQTQRTTSEETSQTLRKQFNKLKVRHGAELRDLKQQFDQLMFSIQPNRSVSEDNVER
jgi:predicted RNase H-like nuclease (RuvC/YqgF family)